MRRFGFAAAFLRAGAFRAVFLLAGAFFAVLFLLRAGIFMPPFLMYGHV